ncbi:MAG: HlyD family efflux transporter periplasmic adaptor subunit [Planctomycetota bacterium]|nr:HlyD family efflux transporter periplasmic adaptor subunit [Planctomycetota bacterium]
MSRAIWRAILLVAVTGGLTVPAEADKPSAPQVKGAVLKLIEQVELPSRDAGILVSIDVHEGDTVTRNQKVAQLDDRVARLAVSRAETELSAARHTAERGTAVLLAKKRAERERYRIRELQTQAEIADEHAGSEISLKLAERSRDFAAAALRRVKQVREANPSSVSEKELDQYQHSHVKSLSEVEQAAFEIKLAKMKAAAQRDAIRGQELTAESFGLEIEDAEADQAQARIQQKLKEEDLRIRQLSLEFQELRSPIDGVVTERYRFVGESVEPGERVLRIVHLKRLRAEGFLQFEQADQRLLGKGARFVITLEGGQTLERTGKIVHVGSEIEPVSRVVKVWAEIDNTDLALRPGMQGTLIVESPASK